MRRQVICGDVGPAFMEAFIFLVGAYLKMHHINVDLKSLGKIRYLWPQLNGRETTEKAEDGTEHHFDHIRREIEPLLPKQASCILDVGARSGATLAWFRVAYPSAQMTGIEINADVVTPKRLCRNQAGTGTGEGVAYSAFRVTEGFNQRQEYR